MTLNPASDRLAGLVAAVDVQHLYRASHPGDRGTVFHLVNGTTVTEADCATVYAQALTQFLRNRGATVYTNAPATGMLVGYYSRRNAQATKVGCHVYLACHVNAGRGGYALAEYLDPNEPRSPRPAPAGAGRMQAARLANWIGGALDQFPAILGYRTQALRHGDRGAVCIEATGPDVAALVVEPLFGDNPAHQVLLTTDGLTAVGNLIGQGVASWWSSRSGAP